MAKKHTEEYYEDLHRLARKHFGRALGEGCTRGTYRYKKNHVIKVPLNEWGFKDNRWEARMCQMPKYQKWLPMARSRMLYVPRLGIEVLRMERLSHLWTFKGKDRAIENGDVSEPFWLWNLDGDQFGYTKAGKLVVFDYADQWTNYWDMRDEWHEDPRHW